MATTSVFFFALLALLSLARGQNNYQCTVATYGNTNATGVVLPTAYYTFWSEWDLYFSNECYNVGMRVKACDPLAPPLPDINIMNTHRAIIHRRSGAIWRQTNFTVDVTIYCGVEKKSELINTPKVVALASY